MGSWPAPPPETRRTRASSPRSRRTTAWLPVHAREDIGVGGHVAVDGVGDERVGVTGEARGGGRLVAVVGRRPAAGELLPARRVAVAGQLLGHHGHADGAGVGGAAGARARVGGAPAPGLDVGGGVGALARGGRGIVARLQRLGQRDQRVDHGLVALLGLAELLDAADGGAHQRGRAVLPGRDALAGAQQRDAAQRARSCRPWRRSPSRTRRAGPRARLRTAGPPPAPRAPRARVVPKSPSPATSSRRSNSSRSRRATPAMVRSSWSIVV